MYEMSKKASFYRPFRRDFVESGFRITVSLVNYNGGGAVVKTARCVLEQTKAHPVELFVFDNGSSDGSDRALEAIPGVRLVRTGKNIGFGAAHNRILLEETGRYLAVINPDISFDTDVLSRLCEVLEEHPEIGMITPRIFGADGQEQFLPKRTPTKRYVFLGRLSRIFPGFRKYRDEYTRAGEPMEGLCEIENCTGCFFVIRSELFREIGGFDEGFFMYFEDSDLSRRVGQRAKIVFDGDCRVTHLWKRESAGSLRYLFIHLKSCFRYFKKWRNHHENSDHRL